MSSGNVLTFPEKPEEYFSYGSYVNPDYGNSWVFGLPATPQSTSNTCGAMPFRSGTGLCSPNCLRGEDWVFMAEWANDRRNLMSWAIPDWGYIPWPSNVIERQPKLSQLSNMYENLTNLKNAYGTDFSVEDQQVQYNDVETILVNGLDRSYSLTSQQPPSSGNVPLQKQRIANFFTDMAKMKCTIGQASHGTPGTRMGKELYWYSHNDGQEPDDYEASLDYLRLSGFSYWGDRPVQFDAQFVGLFYAHEVIRNNYGQATTNRDGYALMNLGSKTTITQDFNAERGMQFAIPFDYGGAGAADDVAGILGMESNPSPPKDGDSFFEMYIDYLYVVIWPKYLQLS